jgi:hypothetical protein
MVDNAPTSQYDVPVCVSAHASSILSCSTPVAKAYSAAWHTATRQAAGEAGVAYVDPTFWVCSSSPCPPIVGNFLVYRDNQHMTPPFAESIAKYLGRSLPGFPQDGSTGRTPEPSPGRSPSMPPAVIIDAPVTAPAGWLRLR